MTNSVQKSMVISDISAFQQVDLPTMGESNVF